MRTEMKERRIASTAPAEDSGVHPLPVVATPAKKVVHVTTVPSTLQFLRGQAGYFRSRGCEIVAVSSPGPALEAFGRQEGVAVRGV